MDHNASNIPSDIAYAYSVGHIPPDITLATLLESRDGPSKIGIYAVFALTFIFLLFRCYSRIFVVKRFGLDDWLACLTFVRQVGPRFEMIPELTSILIDSLYTPRAIMCFINQQRKRSTQRLRQLCHVPGRRSNELWRITGHNHALPVHHRTLYLSSLRSRILHSTIRRPRQTLQFHSCLYNRFHHFLSRAVLSFIAPLHPGHRRMAIFLAGGLPRIQVHDLGCGVHHYFMSIVYMRRRHVHHSVHVDPSFTCAVEKEIGTGLRHVSRCTVSEPLDLEVKKAY